MLPARPGGSFLNVYCQFHIGAPEFGMAVEERGRGRRGGGGGQSRWGTGKPLHSKFERGVVVVVCVGVGVYMCTPSSVVLWYILVVMCVFVCACCFCFFFAALLLLYYIIINKGNYSTTMVYTTPYYELFLSYILLHGHIITFFLGVQ